MQAAKKLFTLMVAILIITLAVVQIGYARKIFVDPDGDNTLSGSKKNPWQTLQHAVDMASPGDVIKINSGTYAGFRAEVSGEEGAWITIKPNNGAEVIIDRPGPKNRKNSNLEFETWEGDGTVSYWKVSGLKIKDAPRAGIDIRGTEDGYSHHFKIFNNEVWNSGRTGIFTGFVNDVRVQGNQSHGNGEHGVYLSNSGDRQTVYGNSLYDNYACGVQLNADASMGGDGIISDVLIKNNQIFGNGEGGGAGINLDGVINSRILGNNIYDNQAGGIALFQIDGGLPSSDALIKNNTIDMPLGSRWGINLTDVGVVNVKIWRNTITHADPYKGSIRLPQEYLDGFRSNRNTLTGRFSVDGGDTILGWDDWQALGYDLKSTEINDR